MTKLILALAVGVLTTGAAFFLISAFHRLSGNLFGPMVERISGAPSESDVTAKQERRNKRSVRVSKGLTVFYAIVLGLLGGLAVWQST